MKQLIFFCVLALCSWVAQGQGSMRELCPTEPACLGCQSRSRITCSSGGLTAFPNLPSDLKADVEELTLRNNGLTGIRVEDLVNYTRLETLIISFNNISYIEPGSFNDITVLRRIDLTTNRITAFPDGLFTTTQLISLLASGNLIDTISAATFTGLQDFSTIDLGNNLLETIPNGTFSSIGRIDQLTLTNNPLMCDCRLRWLRELIDPANSINRPLSSSLGTCTVPSLNRTNVLVSTLASENFVCDCNPPCVNGTCDMNVGVCECSDGYTGNTCSAVCARGTYGAGCTQNCTCVSDQESFPCDHVDGSCNCLPGYEGASCELECLDGFYGQDCMEVCQCQNGAQCDIRTGSCDCGAGWMGQFCNMSCSNGTYGSNCLQMCMCRSDHEASPCNVTDGTCFCLPGYTGSTCDEECPSGQSGEGCDTMCMDDYYGSNCRQRCTCVEQHQSRPCDRTTGECLCLPDYTGRNCELLQDATTTITTTISSRTGVIAGAVVGGVLLGTSLLIAGVVIFSVIFFVVKSHKTRQGSMRISPSQQFVKSDANDQSDINLEPSAPPHYEHINDQLSSADETKLMVDSVKLPDSLEITKGPPL